MAGTRRTRSGRSISQEPTGQNQRAKKANEQDSFGSNPNPSFDNTPLPAVQTQQSFAYGATGSPVIARKLRFDGPTGTSQMAAGMQRHTQGNDFDRIAEEARANPDAGRMTRSRGASVPRQSASPTRAVRGRHARTRERTPEDQLMEALREASEEAEDSKQTVLPSIEQSSVIPSVEQSTLSWQTERIAVVDPANPSVSNVGNNSLAGSVGDRQQESATGPLRPIADPPLRPQVRSQPLPDFSSSREIRFGASSMGTVRPAARLGAIPVLNPTQPERHANPVPVSKGTPPSSSSSPSFSAAANATDTPVASSQTQQRSSLYGLSLMTILLVLLALGGTLSQFAGLKGMLPEGLTLPVSFCSSRPATTEYVEAFNKLSAGVDQRLTDMSRDVTALKEEWNKRLPHLKQAIWPEKEDPLSPRRLNWFSVGLGALVDPYLTTRYHAGSSSSELLTGTKKTNPPIAALTRWDEHGDCWCVTNHPSEIQLGVLLGRPLVPEEVVIEHIWKEATLDPESAPREMELWVEYAARVDSSALSSSGAGSASTGRQSSATSSPAHMKGSAVIESSAEARAIFSAPLSPAQREDVTSTLRMVYPDEPEAAYSVDNNLGATFYRVGRFQYDINGKQNIQKFQLDAVIDLADVRVKRAVLRVKSNWGSVNTCLYRVRLHGHM